MQKIKVTYEQGQIQAPSIEGPILPIVSGATTLDASKACDLSCKDVSVSQNIAHLKKYFRKWRGVRYRYGGRSIKGVDCSGLILRAYKDLYGIDLPRTVAGQARKGVKVKRKSLCPGDLIFFKTGRHARHVGMYVGENQFIHASRSKGVMRSNLDNVYWQKKYWQAKCLRSAKL